MLFLTVDRWIATHRLDYSCVCTARRACSAVIGSFVIIAIYTSPHAAFAELRFTNICVAIASRSLSARIYALTTITLNGFVPFALLLTLNLTIIYRFKKDNSYPSSRDQKAMTENQIRLILILVTFVLLGLTLPQYVRYLVFTIVTYEHSHKTQATFIFCYHLTQKLVQTNCAVNFYLYCLSGQK